jgi:hypothetical protein
MDWINQFQVWDNFRELAGFQVPSAVYLKVSFFWGVAQRMFAVVYRRLETTCFLLQGLSDLAMNGIA